MVTIGNHEFDYSAGQENDPSIDGERNPQGAFRPDWWNGGSDSGGECGVPVHSRFEMPESPLSNGVFWYAFDYANVHTVMMSSEHNCTQGSPQYQFLEQDLAKVDRSKTPWVVVEFHRPMCVQPLPLTRTTPTSSANPPLSHSLRSRTGTTTRTTRATTTSRSACRASSRRCVRGAASEGERSERRKRTRERVQRNARKTGKDIQKGVLFTAEAGSLPLLKTC
jgi:hypothetical protein